VNTIYDTQPLNISETKAWNLRPRSKDLEVGPTVRHKPILQMERVYDKITSEMPRQFQNKHLAKPQAHSQLRSFLRSGDKQYFLKKVVPSTTRESKLGNNVCVVQPQHVLGELHKKSYFKAATGFMLGQEKSLEHKHTEKMVEAFASISQNIQKKKTE